MAKLLKFLFSAVVVRMCASLSSSQVCFEAVHMEKILSQVTTPVHVNRPVALLAKGMIPNIYSIKECGFIGINL